MCQRWSLLLVQTAACQALLQWRPDRTAGLCVPAVPLYVYVRSKCRLVFLSTNIRYLCVPMSTDVDIVAFENRMNHCSMHL